MRSEYSFFEEFMLSKRMSWGRILVLQVLLFALSLNAFGTPNGLFIYDNERIVLWTIFFVMLNLNCFLNVYIFVPRLFLTGKIFKYIGAVSLSTLSFLIAMMFFQPSTEDIIVMNRSALLDILNVFSSIASISFVIVSTTAFALLRYWMQEQQRVDELKSATGQMELQLLKQQINPHFLFNMLNNANVLLKRDSKEAASVLFKFEDLLRYQINDSTHETVTLASELKFLTDYLNLEKIRRENFEFSVTTTIKNVNDINLPPLLFIPFVENAIKHNTDGENDSYVNINFEIVATELIFICRNSIPKTLRSKSDVGGIGLNNIKRRLQLLYPNRNSLNISQTDTEFSVALKLEYKTR